MSRHRQRVSARRKSSKRPTLRQLQRALPKREHMSRGLRMAQELFLEMRSRQRRRRKPPTIEQLLRTVVTILVIHLSDFDYRKQPKSSRAGVARMLASLCARLVSVVEPKRGGR
jgi:hypothetical protein